MERASTWSSSRCALSYGVAPGSTPEEFDEADRAYLSDDYKRRVLEHMSINQLIDTILINPTVQLSPSRRDTGFTATYSFQPLSNLVYTRDQQVTTCQGVVMGRLRSPQRQLEVDLMRFCFNKLGLPVSEVFFPSVVIFSPSNGANSGAKNIFSIVREREKEKSG